MNRLKKTLLEAEKLFQAKIARMQGLINRIIGQIKSIASRLRPALLDDLSLIPTVNWLAYLFQKRTSIPCRFECGTLPSNSGDPIESAISRMAQEGSPNIERHAQASRVKITLCHHLGQISPTTKDDGAVFSAGGENKHGRFGLIAMQEKIYTLGGTINIRNIAPKGAAIYASIPVDSTFHFSASAT